MLEFMLRESEQLGGKIRRYTSPDEHAFYRDDLLVSPSYRRHAYLDPSPPAEAININERVMDMYVNNLLPALCEAGDDNNYGSTGLADIAPAQTIEKDRIHYHRVAPSQSSRRSPRSSPSSSRRRTPRG